MARLRLSTKALDICYGAWLVTMLPNWISFFRQQNFPTTIRLINLPGDYHLSIMYYHP